MLPDDFASIEDLKGLGGLPGQSKRSILDKAAIRAERNSRMSHLGLGSHAKIEALLEIKSMEKLKLVVQCYFELSENSM